MTTKITRFFFAGLPTETKSKKKKKPGISYFNYFHEIYFASLRIYDIVLSDYTSLVFAR